MEQFKENYQNQNERMNPQLENMLKSMQSDLANNPAFPKTDANGNPINFIELIGYKRFLDVIEKVKRYTNLQNVTGGGLGQLSSMLMQGVQFIQQVEAPHKQELENLAVDLVVEEMEIPDGAFQFQCKLVPVGSINQDGFQKDAQEPNEEEINQAFENESQNVEIPADELFEDEKHKRRFINMLIQGSSKKGHYMFELVRNKVNEYNPNLAETYGKVMSINDLIYWLLDDQTIKQMASSSSSMAGKEEIEEGEDGDTIIKTEAICFPVSLHEIIKGTMEVFGTQGLPDDPQQANLVIDAVDSLSNETMDLRLGVPCWEKIYGVYPDFILEEGNRYLQNYLFARYCALPTDEFFRVSRLILSDDPKGAKYFAKMVDEIQNDLQQEDYEKNIDDINLDDLLGFAMGGRIGKWKKSKTMIFPTKEEAEKRLAFLENYDSLRNIQMKKLENGYVIFFEHLVTDDAYGKDTTQYRISKLKLNQNRGFEGYKLPDDFKKGGGVEKGYNVFNYTDNVYATDEVFKTKKLANEFIKEFRNRFSRQGYYRDNQMNKIAIEDIDLLAIPSDFSPFIKFNGGGGVETKFYVMDAKDGKILSKGFDTEEEAKVEKFKIFEKTNNFFLTQKEMTNDGGGIYVDLFEDYENIPANVKSILDYYELEESDYDTLNDLQNELADVGYTFDFGLDYQPYGLRPIGVKITELQGYEDFDDSDKFDGGGEAEFDVYNYDEKMALINLGQIYEYAIELDKIIDENTDLEEWVKMKLTRIEQNIADVKHSLEGWEKYSSGGEIAKKQLLHIAKYSKDLIEMISNGSKLMSWQEGKLSISAQSIDDIYHHLDYKMGNRAVDLENELADEYRRGGRPIKREKVLKVRARGGYSLEDFFPLFEYYDQVVSYKKVGKLELQQIVGKNGVENEFEFKTEADRDYWFEILNKEQETYFTVKNKKKYVKFVLDNLGNYSEEAEDNDLKTLSEKLDYFVDDLDYDLRLNTTREDFIYYLDLKDKFVDGGEVQGWMKEALLNLQLVEDDNSLQITHTNEDSFYVEGDSAEYRVFETYAIAYDTAIEQVREDLEENPDYFNQDWLLNWVDMDDSIENILEEYYRSYADDLAVEDDSRYNNRLIAEMVANGLMTKEEATSEEADEIAEDNVDNLVDLYVEENMEMDKGINWYINNFGEDNFRDFIIDNNLIDISGASEDAIDTDGVAHFLSSYDGEEIELDNDVVAYRTN